MTPPSLTLILPGYNEEASIEEAVRSALALLAGLAPEHEIVIVDDGSTDGTPALADRRAAESPAVRVIHNPVGTAPSRI